MFAFQCYFNWFSQQGHVVDTDSIVLEPDLANASVQLKKSLISYLFPIIRNPNDFFSILITGEAFNYLAPGGNVVKGLLQISPSFGDVVFVGGEDSFTLDTGIITDITLLTREAMVSLPNGVNKNCFYLESENQYLLSCGMKEL